MAKPKKTAAVAQATSKFNLLSRGAKFGSAVKEALAESSGRLKAGSSVMFDALASNKTKLIPINDFGLQYLLNSKGFISGRIFDIIGTDGVGKSTLCFTMLGWAMRHNIPSLYVETEGKPMAKERVMRCLHPNRQLAEQMFEVLQFEEAYELTDAINKIERWVHAVRSPKASADVRIPNEVPVVVVLDTFSKLMSPKESVGFDYYKSGGATGGEDDEKEAADKKKKKPGAKKEKKKEVMEIDSMSNMEHAKIAHRWCRRLPSFLVHNNCFLIIVRHQNEKVDMSGGGGSFVPLEVVEGSNRTSIGGKAFGQSCAYQVVIASEKAEFAQIRGERKRVSQGAKIKVSKNSYGQGGRSLRYNVVLEPRRDTETEQEMSIDFSVGLPDVLSQTGMFAVRIKSANSVAVKELGVEDATPQDVSKALHQKPELMQDIGKRLGFEGLKDPVREVPDLNPMFASDEAEQASA